MSAPGGPRPSYFVGFPLAAPAVLDGVPRAPAGVRVFDVADVHVTLAFFGACGPERAVEGMRAVDAAAMAPVEVTLAGARLLGHPRHPTAVARLLGEGAGVLVTHLAAQRDRALAAAGCAPERRAPLPHATIARVRRRASATERTAAESWARAIVPSAQRVMIDRVALYTWSEERAGGATDDGRNARRYRIVEERPLGPA